ncbi:SiaB family protein kinase [Thermophagus sp. OGC60D27]|uniref:SiaB family protein kinase n=1 Tax=Thermophagus sp. OGC60D27 TaxID=3458415 RepID=UPI0040378B47
MGFNLEEWYAHKLQGDVILKHVGSISPEMITHALEAVEENSQLKQQRLQTRKKLYNVFVECMQNLYHHVDAPPASLSVEGSPNFGIVIVVHDGSFFRITTGNFIDRSKVSFIKDRIEQLNSLSDEEVRLLYRDILGNEAISEKGGGGLGMLDIVRKTGNKLEYFLYPYDEEHVFFSLDVYIS